MKAQERGTFINLRRNAKLASPLILDDRIPEQQGNKPSTKSRVCDFSIVSPKQIHLLCFLLLGLFGVS